MKATEKLTSTELDKKIVSMIQSGSASEKEEGFALLFKKYKQSVFANLNKALNSDSDTAKDLMMDVFTKIHLKFDSYSSRKGALSTWIFNIVKNTMIDHKRKSKYQAVSLDKLSGGLDRDGETFIAFQVEDDDKSNDSLGLLVRDERVNALIIALNKIKRDEVRKAFVLYYFEDKSYKEIALELNLTEYQLKVFLHRGKKELKKLLVKAGFSF